MTEKVPGPLGHHDGDHDEKELVDVVGYLHHDHGQRHCQPEIVSSMNEPLETNQ